MTHISQTLDVLVVYGMRILVTMGDSKNAKLNRQLETIGDTTLISCRWLRAPVTSTATSVFIGSLFCLAALGAIGARLGGAAILKPTLRVAFWGAFAMATTADIGALLGSRV